MLTQTPTGPERLREVRATREPWQHAMLPVVMIGLFLAGCIAFLGMLDTPLWRGCSVQQPIFFVGGCIALHGLAVALRR